MNIKLYVASIQFEARAISDSNSPGMDASVFTFGDDRLDNISGLKAHELFGFRTVPNRETMFVCPAALSFSVSFGGNLQRFRHFDN